MRTLWLRDRDPHLDSLRLRLHLRVLLMIALLGLSLLGLRFHSEHRVDLVPLVPLGALLAWAWLLRHPQHNRRVAIVGIAVLLGVGLLDLRRPGQSIPWALFALGILPVYGTLVDGLVSGGLATAALGLMWFWEGAQSQDVSLRLLIIFNGLSSLCFYFTSLVYIWVFGALLEGQTLNQNGIALASDASRSLAATMADQVTVAVGRLRSALRQGLPDRRTLKGLQELLLNTRQALPQDLPNAPIQPDALLRQQRRAAHRAYIFLALIVSTTASIITYFLGFHDWWIAAGLMAACVAFLTVGEKLPLAWPWRLRLFLLFCLSAPMLDVGLAFDGTPACSLAFLPLIVFYAGMLDSALGATVVWLASLGLLTLEYFVTKGHLWPYYGSLLFILGSASTAMLGICWAVAPSLREQLAGLADQEEQLRASLLNYRRVVSTLFHDLANPLAVLQTLASLPPALLQPEDQERAQRMVERLETVTFSARQQAPVDAGSAISLQELDHGLHDLFQERLAARRLTLMVTGPIDQTVRGEARLRDSLMGHLLSNAARYSPEGSMIVLEAGPSDGGLRITLRDSGPGFPADVLQDLGRGAAPLARPDARGELGNGFGLLLALAAARDLGGRLNLSNANSGGALAELWLPG